ncbi:protein kinase [Colletotrichum lupini]|uniref:Protein kinase n=1 Tax=Colletotrichum lupini TaxID=145971 RepID=A0A9Q8T6X2_9PEZI|nr:protein kinase [Colletotrichum lupini]UQC90018.1 protein kinase [Colletotrichum lupini]
MDTTKNVGSASSSPDLREISRNGLDAPSNKSRHFKTSKSSRKASSVSPTIPRTTFNAIIDNGVKCNSAIDSNSSQHGLRIQSDFFSPSILGTPHQKQEIPCLDETPSATIEELTQGVGLGIPDWRMVPAIIKAEISDLVRHDLEIVAGLIHTNHLRPQDIPYYPDRHDPSPTPGAALAPITGNGLPPESALPPPAVPFEPSEVMDRGDQMYTKAVKEGLLPVSPTQEDPLLDPFEDRLYMSFKTNPQTHRQFLPKGQLNSLIRKQPVIQELKRKVPGVRRSSYERLASTICDNHNPAKENPNPPSKSYQKVFAILVLIDMVPSIQGFIDEGICDQDLPLVKAAENGGLFELRVGARRNYRLKTFLSWTRVSIRNFEEYQWTILPPFFTKGKRKNVKHYVLAPHIVLPFTSTSNHDDIGAAEMHGGGFSRVFKAEIHPDHHDFSNSASEPSPQVRPNTFAVKCLNSPSKELFQKEVQVLKKFSGDSHPHLISLLATYEQSGHFYLIFPWAEADLMKYWKELNPRPILSFGTISWMAEQCQGIADGLVRLHQYDSDLQEKASQSTGLLLTPLDALNRDHESSKRRYGRHGDIKPENILWFHETLESIDQGILRLTDFGLAELHSRLSRSNQHGSQMANSPTYRPPECDLRRRIIRQSCDIWSLGCVFLEFITWSLGGKDLLLEFAELRFSPDPWLSGIDSDTFFTINTSEAKDSSTASVKPAVVRFVDRLHSHPACSEYLHHFLNMIMFGMLVIESEDPRSGDRRITCIEVLQRLSMWRDMCVASSRFCSEPAQRPLDDQSWNSHFPLRSPLRVSQLEDHAGHSSRAKGGVKAHQKRSGIRRGSGP